MNINGIDQTEYFESNLTAPLDSIYLADFTGDGMLEALAVSGVDSEILKFTARDQLNQLSSGGFPNSYHYINFGDFNGDGITDVIVRTANNWLIDHYNGSTFTGHQYITPMLSQFNEDPDKVGSPFRLRIADIDKDGRDDLLFISNQNLILPSSDVDIYYNKITGWQNTSLSNIIITFPSVFELSPSLINLSDFDGDGSLGIFAFPIENYLKFRLNDKSKYVYRILDGLNTLTTIEYKPLTDNSVYDNNTNHSYPNPSLTAPMYVASSVEQTGKFGTTLINQSFFYKTLRYNKKGLGLLGFEEEESKNNINNSKSTVFAHFPPISGSLKQSRPMLPWKQETKVEDNNGNWQLVSRSETTYNQDQFQTFSNRFNYLIRPVETKSYDFISETSNISEFTYDNHGNVTLTEERIYDNVTQSGTAFFESTTEHSDFVNNGSWIPWQPEIVETTQKRTGEDPVSSIKYLKYDSRGNLVKMTKNPSTEAEVIKEYTYDNFGNITSEKISPMGMISRESIFTYTPCHRFVETSTNPKNWIDTYEYNLLLGVKTKHIDINGLETEYEYDGFGRLSKTILPDGNTSEQEITWNIGFGPSSYLYSIHRFGSVELSSVEFYNDAQRVIRQSNMNSVGNYIHTDVTYNNKGLKTNVSLPYESGQNILWNTNQYDYLGRTIQTNNQNSTTNYTYNGREVTAENVTLNQISSQLFDPLGLVIEAADEGGTIEYEYNSFGSSKTISGPSNSPITSIYDDFGRQIELNDPAAGVINYQYDALGQITRQEDSKGMVFEMEYDILGRLIEKHSPEGIFEYRFDAQLLGLLDEAISPNNEVNIEYGYDGLGRMTNRVENINGENFHFEYTYNSDGLPETYMYPNGFIVEYEYNPQQKSVLQNIKRADNNENIWTFGSENQYGQMTQYYLGSSSLQWNRNFETSTGLPTTWTNQQGDWNISYDFDLASANLLSRHNNHIGTSDAFTYDDVNRLKEITTLNTANTSNTIDVSYSTSGSIESKTDVGTYNVQNSSGRTLGVSDPNINVSDNMQIIEYTSFNKISTISEGDYDAYFMYGPDEQRRHMKIYEGGREFIERYYVSDFEREFANGHGRDICYIPLPSGDMALYIDPHGSSGEIYFAYQDYQGSILAIADDNGGIIEEYSYDAWGNRRDASTLENNYYPTGANGVWQGFFHRGYTGHEHLECFGLINMNGRLYDPLLGRMLSPDKYVQAPDFSQNFNRYSYAWNNPLTYSDPSGDIVITTALVIKSAAILMGAYVGGSMANGTGNIGDWDWQSGSTYAGIVLGGAAGYFGGSHIASGFAKTTSMNKAVLAKTNAWAQVGSATYGGGLNVINNYHSDMTFGEGLSYFTAGFLGTAAGMYVGPVAGMGVGGLSTMTAGYVHGNIDDTYGASQHFIGGAASAWAGTSMYHSYAKSANYDFAGRYNPSSLKSHFWSGKGGKAVYYAAEGVANDFAYGASYADEKNFFHGMNRFLVAGGRGIINMAHGDAKNQLFYTRENKPLTYTARAGVHLALPLSGYLTQGYGLGYIGQNKSGLITFKTTAYTFGHILGGL
ncbi:MAG: FG-GAP-like repeat-containing protein [Wenzhouxiangella sp.]|nr:FG-GAP-like repeat-containing protein [Wenzhouxiangella sp.]